MEDFSQLFTDAADRFKATTAGDPVEGDRRVRRAEAAAARLTCRASRDGWLPFDYPAEMWPVEPIPSFSDEEPWVQAWRLFAVAAAMHSGGALSPDLGDWRPAVVRDDPAVGVRILCGGYQSDGWRERAADFATLCRMLAGSSKPMYLGNGRVRIGEETIGLESNQEAILEALLNRGGTATISELRSDTLVDDVPRVLKRICKRPGLEQHIVLPGGRGKGGYRTTIIDGR